MTEGIHLDDRGMGQAMTSRKKFLAGSAALLAGGALMAVPGTAKAHEQPDPPSDIDILNYALTLEKLELAFYQRVLGWFSQKEFEQAKIFDGLGSYVRLRTYENFQRIGDHENTHTQTLEDVIRSLGGQPVPRCEYNFGVQTVGDAVQVGQLLENTGVTAYNGAIAHIETAELLTAGATIATVEARHASYLNLLNRDSGFPSAFDRKVAPRKICMTVNDAFITDSPEPYGPYASLGAFCQSLPSTTN